MYGYGDTSPAGARFQQRQQQQKLTNQYYRELGMQPSGGMHPSVADILRNYPRPEAPLPNPRAPLLMRPRNMNDPEQYLPPSFSSSGSSGGGDGLSITDLMCNFAMSQAKEQPAADSAEAGASEAPATVSKQNSQTPRITAASDPTAKADQKITEVTPTTNVEDKPASKTDKAPEQKGKQTGKDIIVPPRPAPLRPSQSGSDQQIASTVTQTQFHTPPPTAVRHTAVLAGQAQYSVPPPMIARGVNNVSSVVPPQYSVPPPVVKPKTAAGPVPQTQHRLPPPITSSPAAVTHAQQQHITVPPPVTTVQHAAPPNDQAPQQRLAAAPPATTGDSSTPANVRTSKRRRAAAPPVTVSHSTASANNEPVDQYTISPVMGPVTATDQAEQAGYNVPQPLRDPSTSVAHAAMGQYPLPQPAVDPGAAAAQGVQVHYPVQQPADADAAVAHMAQPQSVVATQAAQMYYPVSQPEDTGAASAQAAQMYYPVSQSEDPGAAADQAAQMYYPVSQQEDPGAASAQTAQMYYPVSQSEDPGAASAQATQMYYPVSQPEDPAAASAQAAQMYYSMSQSGDVGAASAQAAQMYYPVPGSAVDAGTAAVQLAQPQPATDVAAAAEAPQVQQREAPVAAVAPAAAAATQAVLSMLPPAPPPPPPPPPPPEEPAQPENGGDTATADVSIGPAPYTGSQDGVLEHYWQFVRENPYDFNGWTYLLQHVEKENNLDAIRGVFNAFLPLYPYCYAYWKKYADMEYRSGYKERALQILERGVTAIPLSVDLWMALLNQHREFVKKGKTAQEQIRVMCERAVQAAGHQFRADSLWESYIQWEIGNGQLSRVTDIYRRLLKIPTRLYNRHWDNFLQHIREYHPRNILERDEYLVMRKTCCEELKMPYREEPSCEPGEVSKTPKPEAKLISAIKEKLVAQMVAIHETTEKRAEKRWKLEDKIKRPYFHVIPLDRRQLRAWRDYLDLETREFEAFGPGADPTPVVMLYERCLIACAQYEEYWSAYARFLESQMDRDKKRKEADAAAADTPAVSAQSGDSVSGDAGASSDASVKRLIESERADSAGERQYETESQRLPEQRLEGVSSGYAPLSDPVEAVREVYKRACLVHCPSKPNIRLQWAAFEEERGNVDTARQLVTMVVASFPTAVGPRLQQIGLERRQGQLNTCDSLYKQAAQQATEQHIKTWWYMKHSRFCFKVLNKPDKALGILRTAVKKDKANPRLYLHILDVCYQRNPVDVRGVAAALTLALGSKELSSRDKLGFHRKKVEFFEEFGTVTQLRHAEDALLAAERALAAEERKQLRQQQQQQQQEQQQQQQQAEDAQQESAQQESAEQGEQTVKAEDTEQVVKAEDSDQPAGKRRKRKSQVMEPTPPPVQNGETPDQQQQQQEQQQQQQAGFQTCPNCGWDAAAAAAAAQGQDQQQNQPPEVTYNQVPPTWDLTMKTQAYGYGKHPQFKWFQERGYKEYSEKEEAGYPPALLDPPSSDEEGELAAPAPAQPPAKKRRWAPEQDTHIVTRDGKRVPRYIIQPQAPTMRHPPRSLMQALIQQPTDAPGEQEDMRPPQLARLPPHMPHGSEAACINAPDWLLTEGGELCLSESDAGVSVLRYWPHFMTEKGIKRMFNMLRRYVKWHQKRYRQEDGRWVPTQRLLAWFGPCGYERLGCTLPTNSNWSPELLDLLRRLNAVTGNDFNSCLLSLFRHGHDFVPWQADLQPAMGQNPSVALVSLGAIRTIEFRRRSMGGPGFLRFPLFPGSLLVMEGTVQSEWLHQIRRDPGLAEERISLEFRTMYDLQDMQTGGQTVLPIQPSAKPSQPGGPAKPAAKPPVRPLMTYDDMM